MSHEAENAHVLLKDMAITETEERTGLVLLHLIGVELPIPREMTRQVAGYIARNQADNTGLKQQVVKLREALQEIRGHLASYSRRQMWGSDCDDDVNSAQRVARIAWEETND